MTPGMNARAFDYPSLALAARAAARDAEDRRQQAAEILDLVGGEHVGTRREASRLLAHAAAQHLDLRRLEHLAALHEQHPVLADAIAALEAGGRVIVAPPMRVRPVSGPPGPTRSKLLNRWLVVVGWLRPEAVEVPVFARRSA
ncbi:hypothetical protein DK419_13430 [Methylobacterium terrae]|uniref:Uncharacterized protein n=1 Tax=Methylobacterium terrae TaxID=2202827 RepID=A0A2U8WLR5_9HYPH|nr:hypothetical protein [Methylobacterium terrae]AWN47195.1 hypothetical protein DK419_13430 [Methylobacterium terrae]